jgi:electron-transferring-flavoprotein dehydrogenase
MSDVTTEIPQEIERQEMAVDFACVGFGPAMGGFLTTLTAEMMANPGEAAMESKAAPGMPLQVLCYERADDIAAGVSGVVTRGRAIRTSFPEIATAEIPMLTPVKQEKVLYLLDPIGASRRSVTLRAGDAAIRALRSVLPVSHDVLELPYTPEFLQKHDGRAIDAKRDGAGVAGNSREHGAVRG